MRGDEFINELDATRSRVRKYEIAIAALVVLAIVQACTIGSQSGSERHDFLPPEISRPFWLAGEEASVEYFEDLGQFVNGLPLNITPETADGACRAYVRYVLPIDRNAYKRKCDIEAARVKRDNASESFSVRTIRSDVHARRVLLEGIHTAMIHDQRFASKRSYLIEFVRADGRFYVRTHEKVNDNDPRIPKP